MSLRSFAARAKIDYGGIWRIANLKVRPSSLACLKLTEASSGEITADALLAAWMATPDYVRTASGEVNHSHRRKSRASTPEGAERSSRGDKDAA